MFSESASMERIITVLKSLPNLDSMITGVGSTPKSLSDRTVKKGIETILRVNNCLKCGVELHHQLIALKFSENSLLGKVSRNIHCDRLETMLQRIGHVLASSPLIDRHLNFGVYVECFSIRAGIDGMLDLARNAYLAVVDEIHKVRIGLCYW